MAPGQLPVPDDIGIYSFANDLAVAHHNWMHELGRRESTPNPTITLNTPHSGRCYSIERRHATGRPVVAIEPHSDDFILSASGAFLATPRPLVLVTVFANCSSEASVRPAIVREYPELTALSRLRQAESREALRAFGAVHIALTHNDATPPYIAPRQSAVDEVAAQLKEIIASTPDAELIAPAGVTRHPDHIITHRAALQLGCTWWWDEVAFWSTYALSVDDRYLFERRTRAAFDAEAIDITDVILDKLTLIRIFESQDDPDEMWRPIRYAWTVAEAFRTADEPPTSSRFAERYFRLRM